MDQETKDYIDKTAKTAAENAVKGYKQTNSWWQDFRREHPLGIQNALVFGVVPIVGVICFFIGKATGCK